MHGQIAHVQQLFHGYLLLMDEVNYFLDDMRYFITHGKFKFRENFKRTIGDSTRTYDKQKIGMHIKLAFTDQFGFYYGDRYSSPVVQKRLNPYLFYELNFKRLNIYIDFGYGHESNGQVISDPVTFYSIAKVTSGSDSIHQTTDFISRGWDYMGARIYKNIALGGAGKWCLTPDFFVRCYLYKGLLEGYQENYQSWESQWYGADFTRSQVSGLLGKVSLFNRYNLKNVFAFSRITLQGETGIADPFRNNSFKIFMSGNVLYFPMFFSYSYGYNIDIANYGVAIRVLLLGLSLIHTHSHLSANKTANRFYKKAGTKKSTRTEEASQFVIPNKQDNY